MIYTFLVLEIKQGTLQFLLNDGNMLVECWKINFKKAYKYLL